MTNNSPCGCGHDHEEEKDAPTDAGHTCYSGTCHDEDSAEEGCGGSCGCGHDHGEISPEQLEELKQAIIAAGYKIEETADGEIKILEA